MAYHQVSKLYIMLLVLLYTCSHVSCRQCRSSKESVQASGIFYLLYMFCLCSPKELKRVFFMFCSISLQCCSNSVQWTRSGGLYNIIIVKISRVLLPSIVNSYIITSPESGVSDIEEVTQMIVLTLLSSKCCEYNVPIILFCSLTRSDFKWDANEVAYSPCFYWRFYMQQWSKL